MAECRHTIVCLMFENFFTKRSLRQKVPASVVTTFSATSNALRSCVEIGISLVFPLTGVWFQSTTESRKRLGGDGDEMSFGTPELSPRGDLLWHRGAQPTHRRCCLSASQKLHGLCTPNFRQRFDARSILETNAWITSGCTSYTEV